MANPQFGFQELAASQAQPEVPVNAGTRALSAAIAGELTLDFETDADLVMALEEAANFSLVVTDSEEVLSTSTRSVIYPAASSRMQHIVSNLTAEAIQVRRSAQTSGVTIAAGDRAHIWHDGDEIVELKNPI